MKMIRVFILHPIMFWIFLRTLFGFKETVTTFKETLKLKTNWEISVKEMVVALYNKFVTSCIILFIMLKLFMRDGYTYWHMYFLNLIYYVIVACQNRLL